MQYIRQEFLGVGERYEDGLISGRPDIGLVGFLAVSDYQRLVVWRKNTSLPLWQILILMSITITIK
jgi:hypothetical protein